MDNRKVFVIYASAGAGHMKAADAVAKAVKKNYPNADLKLFDSLDYTTSFFKKSYPAIYLFAISQTPTIWGLCYYMFDWPVIDFIVAKMRRMTNGFHAKKLKRFILEEKPDVVISTHFMATEVIGNLKKKGLYKGRLVTVVTDYGLHSFWVHKNCDDFVVASEDTKEDLAKRGIDRNRIYSLGIPIDEAFAKKEDKTLMRKNLGIREDLFTILIVSGGFGVGPILELVKELGSLDIPIQLIVVCGKNPKLVEEVTNEQKRLKNPLKIYGFATNMPELMSASDLMITKSGGLTTSEAMVKGLAMIVIKPVIGQETKNCGFLVKHEAAVRVDNVKQVKTAVLDLFKDKDKLEKMRRNINSIARPNSSLDIAKLALTAKTQNDR